MPIPPCDRCGQKPDNNQLTMDSRGQLCCDACYGKARTRKQITIPAKGIEEE